MRGMSGMSFEFVKLFEAREWDGSGMWWDGDHRLPSIKSARANPRRRAQPLQHLGQIVDTSVIRNSRISVKVRG